MSRLVISVRSADEVESALRGGADLLDVKEPSRGSLGRADVGVIYEVVQRVNGRVPVSAALGEWRERDIQAEAEILTFGLKFVKWGFSGYPEQLPREISAYRALLPENTEMVWVSYGDWKRAGSPPPQTILEAADYPSSTILFDTFVKDGSTLLEHLPLHELHDLAARIRHQGSHAVFAGSLTVESIAALSNSRPTWFAVRGAACGAGNREGRIDEERVRYLKRVVADYDALSFNAHSNRPRSG